MREVLEADVLVIGCGIAGAATALRAARAGRDVLLLSKEADPVESASRYAQGGIIGEVEHDEPAALAADIDHAGAGACYDRAVRSLSEEGPRLVRTLLADELGVDFDRDPAGKLHCTGEAAHSRRRIYHHKDRTGLAIMRGLLAALQREPRVRLLTRQSAIDLITTSHHWVDRASLHLPNRCLGAYVFDEPSGTVRTVLAATTVLATGGLGQVFLHTTNPPGATGDGLAMAARAGARVIDAEFVQFHPTAFFHRDCERFLITEAARGEGGRLVDHAGEPFMQRYEPELKDLAPRDCVARAIYEEMAHTGKSCVFLDVARFVPPGMDVAARFPTIHQKLLEFDVDITRKPIPVVPAAHYSCGGVQTDLEGRTELPGLLAAGEVACTGVHGANRLASTSLMEGLLWGWRAGAVAPAEGRPDPALVPPWDDEGLVEVGDPLLVSQDFLTLKTTMWNYAGIVRTAKRLERAKADLEYLSRRCEQFYRETKLNRQLIELRNALCAARLIIEASARNRRSQGSHYRRD